ncbi:hypothetical protein ETD86_21540 [Nonomuraea turkmeniaca]|uniref:Uncharacterized protein n=1 Tax=Nonomuraea turkmeniaca TaxID=103838 RepID=A0A5S4FG85_9ACTN|nr:hypothetical protein [Nonomuraea turkmeniaca]TMR18536.1 hypothetical protein ETD86_21540 [Nonomuraea turkmeniaca]
MKKLLEAAKELAFYASQPELSDSPAARQAKARLNGLRRNASDSEWCTARAEDPGNPAWH